MLEEIFNDLPFWQLPLGGLGSSVLGMFAELFVFATGIGIALILFNKL